MWKSRFDSARLFFRRWANPRLVRPLAGLAITAMLLAHTTGAWPQPALVRLEGWLYDARVRLFAANERDARIVIIDIDERALAEVGRWPWGRDRLAELVRRLFDEQGVSLLGLDMILAEPDQTSGLPLIEHLARGTLRDDATVGTALKALRPRLDHDQRLADTLARHPVVLGFHLSRSPGAARNGVLPPPLTSATAMGVSAGALTHWNGFGANLALLQAAARHGAGSLNALVDPDGVTRRTPLLARVGDEVHGAFALALARAWLGAPAPQVRTGLDGWLSGVALAGPRGKLQAAVDANGLALLPFRGPQGQFAYVSAADVLAARLPAGSLRGKIALLGTTAPGLLDLRSTPVGEAYPGVEGHANLLSGLLDGSLRHTSADARAIETLLVLGIGVVMIIVLPRCRTLVASLLAWVLLAGVLTLGVHAWQAWHLALPLATGLSAVVLLFGVHLFFGQFVELRSRRRLEALFGRYVPPELVDLMSRNPARYDMQGRAEVLSVLFADVRGFTAISETMAPTELAALMNEFFTAMTTIVRQHRGTLDKYVGDALVAFWGAPVHDEQHAEHAVAAALAMQAALPALNARFAARGWPALQVGMGINSGTMVVGDLGSHQRRAYTVLGDAVNVGARFQTLCAEHGAHIIIGEATRALLPGWPCRELARITVRGRSAAVTIFEPLPR